VVTGAVASLVVRAMREENAPWYDCSGQPLAVLLHRKAAAGRLAAVEVVEARGRQPPRHVHPWHDELLSVLEGEFIFEVGGRRWLVPAGTLAFVPRGAEHGFAVERKPAQLLVVSTPGGLEEGFMGRASRHDRSIRRQRPAPAGGAMPCRLGDGFDTELTGPPVAPER